MKKFVKRILKVKSSEEYMKSLDSKTLSDLLMRIIKENTDRFDKDDAIKFAMDLDSKLYELSGHIARRYGDGVHPKHKHIKFHDFFTSNLSESDNVLDIGSSNGELASDMAKKVKKGKVYGIEIEKWHVDEANKNYKMKNLKIVLGDATKEKDLPKDRIDVITLSNVLEHIEKRSELLKILIKKYNPKKILIRVPSFERDWRVPLKKELDLDYRLDVTHFIEFTDESFRKEMNEAGLEIVSLQNKWGEIWAVLKPKI